MLKINDDMNYWVIGQLNQILIYCLSNVSYFHFWAWNPKIEGRNFLTVNKQFNCLFVKGRYYLIMLKIELVYFLENQLIMNKSI